MKKYLNYFCLTISLIFSFALLSGCTNNSQSSEANNEPIEKSEILMGTVISVKIYDSNDEAILDDVFNKVRELESKLSINDEGTLIDKINEASGINPVEIDEDTYYLLEKGLEYGNISDGRFDITIGPLVKLWSIGLEGQKLPTQEEIDAKLPLINYNDLILNDKEKTAFLKRKEMIIDLGGIAKGYTADVISEMLSERGVNSAIINLGGNILAKGKNTNGNLWKIGIQNPTSERGDTVGIIKIENKSVVTSGIYERYFEENGVRYHHLLDPKTGYPYENNIAGITIVSDKSIDGDALSTSVFAMGIEEGLKFVNSRDDIDAIFVTTDNKIYLSDGIKDNFELSNEDFTIAN
ncbi:MAG: FAD:protein FMN transferase [Clostridiales bacterium]|uniref:FAD:protein FMN transferase n=1 Tax=Clostridium isatidis TaxID=182773 RepID=A0A343JEY9_9CLOT|nr:FAD:protein FMN transferase [Clostridium isatidis]ASW44097.1 thiamine biosynthesis protein ApbE [Clostridium isatidis]NLZ47908.1 FAD:protein FMN transferase [Clostridiales bacterium]